MNNNYSQDLPNAFKYDVLLSRHGIGIKRSKNRGRKIIYMLGWCEVYVMLNIEYSLQVFVRSRSGQSAPRAGDCEFTQAVFTWRVCEPDAYCERWAFVGRGLRILFNLSDASTGDCSRLTKFTSKISRFLETNNVDRILPLMFGTSLWKFQLLSPNIVHLS